MAIKQGVHVRVLCKVVNSHRPVVVEMAQLVRKALHVIRLQLSRVMDDVVVGGSHGALTHGLRHQEEVVPLHITYIRITD